MVLRYQGSTFVDPSCNEVKHNTITHQIWYYHPFIQRNKGKFEKWVGEGGVGGGGGGNIGGSS